jgi:uncharacterized protein YrrD
MIRSAKELFGHQLGANDGHIGHIKDFYFDDSLWVVRYLVADTGSWLTGRLVLVSPLALGGFDEKEKVLRVSLTRRQIENSPPIESHKPLSRRYEQEYYQYYNWPYYWQGGSLWGFSDFPTIPPIPIIPPGTLLEAKTPPEDKHLNNIHAVLGYTAKATDKDVGTIADFLIDDRTWTVTGLAIDTGHWLPGRKAVVSVGQIGRISWNESSVSLKSTSAALERAPALEAVAK